MSDCSRHTPRAVRWGGILLSLAMLLNVAQPAALRAEERPAAPAGQRLLLLTGGRVVTGSISQAAGGYLVEKPNGSMLIPFEQVRLEAADLEEAYQKLRATTPRPTASVHLSLAQWCLTHQLYAAARSELRDALRLEPNRADARTMLQRLEEVLNPENPALHAAPSSQPRTPDGFEAPESHSLAGLDDDAAHEFVAKIQPILLNKCGLASCHGSAAQNDFRLTPVTTGRGIHRVFVERNLAAVLQFVDADRPGQSPLLAVPQGNHGRGGRVIFFGARGGEQLESLQRWVQSVAEGSPKLEAGQLVRPSLSSVSTTSQSSETARNPGDGRVDSDPPDAGDRSMDFNRRDAASRRADFNSHGAEPNSQSAQVTDADDALLQAILREELRDAFDPDVFNRAVHGRKRENR